MYSVSDGRRDNGIEAGREEYRPRTPDSAWMARRVSSNDIGRRFA